MMGSQVPLIRNSKAGVIIRHKEYITDIQASQAFNLRSFLINPGLSETFPWLSQVANAFEEYEFRGLIFEFKSMSSDAILQSSTNSSLGTVILGTQYDVLDTPFSNKIGMENHQYSNSCKPSVTMLHPIECARSQNSNTHLFTRNAPPPATGDDRLYDLGRFQIAVQGCQANVGTCGELWCTYEIQLFKPQLFDYLGGGILFENQVSSTAPSLATGMFGTGAMVRLSGNMILTRIGDVIEVGPPQRVSSSFLLPGSIGSGFYKGTYHVQCTGGAAPNTIGTFSCLAFDPLIPHSSRNITFFTYPDTNPNTAIARQEPVNGISTVTAEFSFFFQVTGAFSNPPTGNALATPNAVLAIAMTGTVGVNDFPGTAQAQLEIEQVNPNLLGISAT